MTSFHSLPQRKSAIWSHRGQNGAALMISLLMLIAVMLLGLSAAQIALQNEKASRNDRDRQIAFQAAESAIADAEMDIQDSPDPVRSRSHIFANDNAEAFVPGCGAGDTNINLGLCAQTVGASNPTWLEVDFLNETLIAATVPLGKFTGQVFQFGQGSLPARLPRYIVESVPYNALGASAEPGTRSHLYRITAIGFGMRDSTRVVLQTFYRKED
jgi:type IV pilus assembly protein PilX